MLLSEWGQCHSVEAASICQHSQCIALVCCTMGHHEKAVLNFTGQAATQGEAGHFMPLCAFICSYSVSYHVFSWSGGDFRPCLQAIFVWPCFISTLLDLHCFSFPPTCSRVPSLSIR
jgi:hypothetical protein